MFLLSNNPFPAPNPTLLHFITTLRSLGYVISYHQMMCLYCYFRFKCENIETENINMSTYNKVTTVL